MMTPTDAAICKIWFDGGHLRLLLHIASLRRELRLLGFESALAEWLSKEIGMRCRAAQSKGKVRSQFFSFGFEVRDELTVLIVTRESFGRERWIDSGTMRRLAAWAGFAWSVEEMNSETGKQARRFVGVTAV